MTKTESKIRQQLTDALVTRAQTDERIIQLRAMLGAATELDEEFVRELDELRALVREQSENAGT